MKIIISILQIYFLFYTWYMFVSVLGALIFKIRYRQTEKKPGFTKFAIMIPAYKANRHILNVIKAAQQQDYPPDEFTIFLLAQHCETEILKHMKESGAVVFEQTFETCDGNPYLHALNYFIEQIEHHDKFDAILLVDKDNLLDADFLRIINNRFQAGEKAVQGKRRPMNLDSNAACMDYVSEASNDQMLRAAKAGFGLSAEVSGSGMAFDFEIYKKAISSVDFKSPVHDKTFYLRLLEDRQCVRFEPSAVLYEEKTGTFDNVSTQRTRWLGGQIYLARKYFFHLLGLGMQQHSFDPIDYAFTLAKIPRALHVLGLAFWIVIAFIFPGLSWISALSWLLYLIAYFAAIICILLLDGAPAPVYKALFSSPLFILSMLKSANGSFTKKIQGKFIHTDHSKEVSLDDIKGKNDKK